MKDITTGILKGLKFNHMFILRNNEIVKFVKREYCYYGKNSEKSKEYENKQYREAKIILDVGDFLTHHGTYRDYYSNGKCACSYLNGDPEYDIIKKLRFTSLESEIYKLMKSVYIVEDVPTKNSLKAVKKIIKFFEKKT